MGNFLWIAFIFSARIPTDCRRCSLLSQEPIGWCILSSWKIQTVVLVSGQGDTLSAVPRPPSLDLSSNTGFSIFDSHPPPHFVFKFKRSLQHLSFDPQRLYTLMYCLSKARVREIPVWEKLTWGFLICKRRKEEEGEKEKKCFKMNNN